MHWLLSCLKRYSTQSRCQDLFVVGCQQTMLSTIAYHRSRTSCTNLGKKDPELVTLESGSELTASVSHLGYLGMWSVSTLWYVASRKQTCYLSILSVLKLCTHPVPHGFGLFFGTHRCGGQSSCVWQCIPAALVASTPRSAQKRRIPEHLSGRSEEAIDGVTRRGIGRMLLRLSGRSW